MPNGIDEKMLLNVANESEIPALTNANKGNIKNATHGCNMCSNICNGDDSVDFSFFDGINRAKITPAIVG